MPSQALQGRGEPSANRPFGDTAGTKPRAFAASTTYAWFVVSILMLAYVFSFVDRQILSLLVVPIRRDLDLSDTQMSLLMGFSFAIFYTVLGIPLGRLADSRSRRGLIVAGIMTWSVMTILCGGARHYWQLFLCRIGVGVGEAALSPAAYSLIADYFPPERRATALSVYSMGIYLGSGIAYLLGGLVVQFSATHEGILLPLIGETRSWQVVFVVLGVAGLVFSPAFALVKEPPRDRGGAAASVPLREVFAYLKLNARTVLFHNLGFAMIAFCSYGLGAWVPTYFVRTHGWSIGEVGVAYGLIVMIAGSSGIVLGGRLADRWRARDIADAPLRVGVWGASIMIPLSCGFLLAPWGWLAASLLALTTFVISMPFGAAAAAIQEAMPNRLRGQASALYLFVVNIIGLGVGPTAVALMTDYVFRDDGAVRYSMLIVSLAALGVGIALLNAGRRPYTDTLARLRACATQP